MLSSSPGSSHSSDPNLASSNKASFDERNKHRSHDAATTYSETQSMLHNHDFKVAEEGEEEEEDIETGRYNRWHKRSSSFPDRILSPSTYSAAWMTGKEMMRSATFMNKSIGRLNMSRIAVIGICVFLGLVIIVSTFTGGKRTSSKSDYDIDSTTGDNSFATIPKSIQEKISYPAMSERDRRDRTMKDERCRKEFPLLYPQLDELMRYWQMQGGISKEMIDQNEKEAAPHWGHVRLIINRGKVYIKAFKEGDETRNSALVHLVQQAVESWPGGGVAEDDTLPTIDLILSPGDKDIFPNQASWTVTKSIKDHRHTGKWLIPDFGFVGWPEAGIASFEEFLDQATEQEEQYPWYRKHTRAFWRGFANVYAVRRDLIQRTNTKKHPERERWADVHETTFHPDGREDWYPLVTLPEHCQHKYLIHVEGNSYSGRSRYLFSCHSVTIAHPLEWTQHFHPALNNFTDSPDQNYVQLPGPFFEGLEEVVHELRVSDGFTESGPEKKIGKDGETIPTVKILEVNGAQKIADNALRILRHRYLTPAATMCYTRAALRHYAESLNATSWNNLGPTLKPGQGILPGSSKGRIPPGVKGDIEVGVWRLLGAPNWPPH